MMSTAAEGKEGKSNVMVSCKHLDGSFKEHNKKEGVRNAGSGSENGEVRSNGKGCEST